MTGIKTLSILLNGQLLTTTGNGFYINGNLISGAGGGGSVPPNLVYTTGTQSITGNKTFTNQQSGTRFEGPVVAYVEFASSGLTGYMGTRGDFGTLWSVNNQTGTANVFARVSDQVTAGAFFGPQFQLMAYSGTADVYYPNRYEFLIGINTGFRFNYIGGVQQNVGFTNVILQQDGGNVGVGHWNPQSKLNVSGDIRVDNGVFKSGVTDISVLYYPKNGNPSGYLTNTNHVYTWVTGNFTFTAGIERYLWSGSAVGISGITSNWATGTLPAASTMSGTDFIVKNLQTGVFLTLSGVIDYSQNYILGSMQAVTLGSNGSSWLLF